MKTIITDAQWHELVNAITYGTGRITVGNLEVFHDCVEKELNDDYIKVLDLKTGVELACYSKRGKYIQSDVSELITVHARTALLNAFFYSLNWEHRIYDTIDDGWAGYRLDLLTSPYPVAAHVDPSGNMTFDALQDKFFFTEWKDGVLKETEVQLFYK